MKEVVKKMESKRKHLKAAASLVLFAAQLTFVARGVWAQTATDVPDAQRPRADQACRSFLTVA